MLITRFEEYHRPTVERLIRIYERELAMASKDEMKKALQDQIKQLQLELKAIDEPAEKEPEQKSLPEDNHADRKSPKSDR